MKSCFLSSLFNSLVLYNCPFKKLLLSNYDIIKSLTLPVNSTSSPTQRLEGPGAFPSCPWVRGRIQPGATLDVSCFLALGCYPICDRCGKLWWFGNTDVTADMLGVLGEPLCPVGLHSHFPQTPQRFGFTDMTWDAACMTCNCGTETFKTHLIFHVWKWYVGSIFFYSILYLNSNEKHKSSLLSSKISAYIKQISSLDSILFNC